MLTSRVCKHPSPLVLGQQWLMSSLETNASPLGQRGKARPPLCLLCLLPGLDFSPRGHQLSVPLLGPSPGVSAGSLPLFGVWARPAPTTFPSLRLEASPCPPHLLLPQPPPGSVSPSRAPSAGALRFSLRGADRPSALEHVARARKVGLCAQTGQVSPGGVLPEPSEAACHL